jgi:maltose phosphorylase
MGYRMYSFYMATKDAVARLLTYRYNQLDKAIETQNNLGFKTRAALYPMVTMNGENATMNGKSHMKKSIETGALLCTTISLYSDYSYIPERTREVLMVRF